MLSSTGFCMNKMGIQNVISVSNIHNKISLSREGKNFLKRDAGERYRMLFEYMATGFNWGYFDQYPERWIVQGGFAFWIFLLQKYGSEKRPPEFYSHRFRIAFPGLYRDFESENDSIRSFERCCKTRVIEKFLCGMGLVEVEYRGRFDSDIISIIKKSLIDRVIIWNRDVFDFDREGFLKGKEEERKKRVETGKKRKHNPKEGGKK